jgi:phytoene dehydrogenase-like protein
MVDITNVLVDLAKSIGVKFHFQYRVKEILTQNQQVKGIRVVSQHREEQELFFDKVVSNMDVTIPIASYYHNRLIQISY